MDAREFGVGATDEVIADQYEDIRVGHNCHIVGNSQFIRELEAQLLNDAVVLVTALEDTRKTC